MDVITIMSLLGAISKLYNDIYSKELNITSNQIKLLRYLSEKGGFALFQELEDYLGLSKPSCSRALGDLLNKEFVSINKNNLKDRRHRQIALSETKDCQYVLQKIRKIDGQMEKAILTGIPESDISFLVKFLKQVHQNLLIKGLKVTLGETENA